MPADGPGSVSVKCKCSCSNILLLQNDEGLQTHERQGIDIIEHRGNPHKKTVYAALDSNAITVALVGGRVYLNALKTIMVLKFFQKQSTYKEQFM